MIDLYDVCKKLSLAAAPTGSERPRGDIIANLISAYVDETFYDKFGNLIAVQHGTGNRIMVCARLDSAGLMMKCVDQKGYVRVLPLGKLTAHRLAGARVRFEGGLEGIVLTDDDKSRESLLINDLVVDVGSQETAACIKVGSPAVFSGEIIVQNNVIIGPSCGSIATCAVLIAVAEQYVNTGSGVTFVFAVQGEVEQRGVKAAAFSLIPEWGIAVDVSEAVGADSHVIPGMARLNAGPVIKIRDQAAIYCREAVDLLDDSAKRAGVSCQYEATGHAEAETTAATHLLQRGAVTGGIGIPVRYRLTANEMVSLRDVEQTAIVLAKALRGMGARTSDIEHLTNRIS